MLGIDPIEVVLGRVPLKLGRFSLRLLRMDEVRPRLPSEFLLAAFPLLLEVSLFLSWSIFLNQDVTLSLNLLDGEGFTKTTVPVSED